MQFLLVSSYHSGCAPACGSSNTQSRHISVNLRQVYIIEANPRASRTVPFVAKAIGHPVAKYASLLKNTEIFCKNTEYFLIC